MTRPPLGAIRYLYVGTNRFDDDLAYYRDVIGAEVVWHFHRFGARVAAFRVCAGPLLLIADHREAPSCLPVFGVPDLDAAVRELTARGWKPDEGPFGIPDGPCYLFRDKSGNQIALFGEERPDILTTAYRERGGEAAVD